MTSEWSIDFWAIGLMGSLTTFSALSLETVLMIDAGHPAMAAAYATLSPVLGLAAARAAKGLRGSSESPELVLCGGASNNEFYV